MKENLELRLEFLHSLLIPSEVSNVLSDPAFTPILETSIGTKKIRMIVEEMKIQDDDQYHLNLVLLRDFLINV